MAGVAAAGAPQARLKPVVLFTGDVRGELPSCGCTTTPPGGVARRKTLIDRQRYAWPAAVVDVGGALFADASAPDEGAKKRAAYLLKLMGRLGTAALAVGSSDLAAGPAFLKREAAKAEVPVLSANLKSRAGRVFPGAVVVDAGSARVAFIGVTAEGPLPRGGGLRAGPALAAVRRELARLGPHDATVVLAATGWTQALALASSLGAEVRAVIVSGDDAEPRAPQRVGQTWVVAASTRGQQIGRLQLSDDGAEVEWLPLGSEVMEDDVVKAEVRALAPPAVYR